MYLNVIDVLLVLVVVVLVVNGYRRGFLLSTLDLLSWVLSFLAALRFYPVLAGWFGKNVHMIGPVSQPGPGRQSSVEAGSA